MPQRIKVYRYNILVVFKSKTKYRVRVKPSKILLFFISTYRFDLCYLALEWSFFSLTWRRCTFGLHLQRRNMHKSSSYFDSMYVDHTDALICSMMLGDILGSYQGNIFSLFVVILSHLSLVGILRRSSPALPRAGWLHLWA